MTKGMCDYPNRNERILDYLYEELDSSEREAFDAHLANCVPCRGEMAGLESTRGRLAEWAVPSVPAGIGLSASLAAPGRPRSWQTWGLAAAATLVLGASAAVANLEMRVGSEGLVVRTGWAQPAAADARTTSEAPMQATAATGGGADAPDAWRGEIARLQARLTELESAIPDPAAPPVAVSAPRTSDAELLRQVRRLIDQSEARQEREIMLRLSQVVRDFDRARRADIAMIQQGMNQYHGLTNAEIANQRETLNQLVRVRQER
jgi:hypothetical protein